MIKGYFFDGPLFFVISYQNRINFFIIYLFVFCLLKKIIKYLRKLLLIALLFHYNRIYSLLMNFFFIIQFFFFFVKKIFINYFYLWA